jgi:uncharacterized membrane protein YcaP (DUF421 family)
MFVPQVPLVESVLRVVLVYALMVVVVRLGGKRGLATMNTLDFVVVFPPRGRGGERDHR